MTCAPICKLALQTNLIPKVPCTTGYFQQTKHAVWETNHLYIELYEVFDAHRIAVVQYTCISTLCKHIPYWKIDEWILKSDFYFVHLYVMYMLCTCIFYVCQNHNCYHVNQIMYTFSMFKFCTFWNGHIQLSPLDTFNSNSQMIQANVRIIHFMKITIFEELLRGILENNVKIVKYGYFINYIVLLCIVWTQMPFCKENNCF